jgi:hypothetical protein
MVDAVKHSPDEQVSGQVVVPIPAVRTEQKESLAVWELIHRQESAAKFHYPADAIQEIGTWIEEQRQKENASTPRFSRELARLVKGQLEWEEEHDRRQNRNAQSNIDHVYDGMRSVVGAEVARGISEAQYAVYNWRDGVREQLEKEGLSPQEREKISKQIATLAVAARDKAPQVRYYRR